MALKKSTGKSNTKETETRCRSWTIVVYPDSAPGNWRDFIDDLHIEWIESPLHDADLDPNGLAKKPHWHVLLLFDSVKAYKQVCELIAPLHCPVPQRCHNARSMVRYMAHLDNPDKHQYSQHEIIGHGGVDVSQLLRPSAGERYDIIRDILIYCKQEGILEYQDLVDAAMTEHFDDWFPLLCDSASYVVGQYIKSQRHRNEG